MIERPTVFVLGAGASKSYGLPTAPELTDKIREELQLDPRGRMSHILIEGNSYLPNGIGTPHAQDLGNRLEHSGLNSIDAFLERFSEDANCISLGKAAIAYCLLPYEDPLELKQEILKSDDNWFDYLFEYIMFGVKEPKDFEKNNLSFISFNYDRTLEFFFYIRILNNFPGISSDQAIETLRSIPIIHVYGSLGEFAPPQTMRPEQKMLPFGGLVNAHTIDIAARSIDLLNVDREQKDTLSQAHQLIEDAEIRAFLGFGYHPLNISRLLLLPEHRHSWLGSCYEMTLTEQARAERSVDGLKIKFGLRNHKCLKFLRNSDILC